MSMTVRARRPACPTRQRAFGLVLSMAAVVSGSCTQSSSQPEGQRNGVPQGTETTSKAAEPTTTDTQADAGSAEAEAQAPPLEVPKLPEGWSGTGVLAKHPGPPSPNAPEWTALEAEVADTDSGRILRATAKAAGIRNGALARSTAAARARRVLVEWTGHPRLLGSRITNTWRSRRGRQVVVQVSLPVPSTWQPGEPLHTPGSKAAANPSDTTESRP